MVDGTSVVVGERIEMWSTAPGRRVVQVDGAASVSNRFPTDRPGPDAAEPEGAEPEAADDEGEQPDAVVPEAYVADEAKTD
ncbi:hypothetical protein L0152_27680, partial [bacterium]|nr:hypothetical protein [bacterium]